MDKKQVLILTGIIIVAAFMRLVPHLPNFTPIAAMALFGGVYLDKKYALVIPIIAMFLSDLVLGFHASMPMVYASFLITGVIGILLRNHKSIPTVVAASVASSLIFFLLTNFNFWYAHALYPKTFDGMVSAYINAIPFFRNTILGDLFYTGVLFGGYELMMQLHSLRNASGSNAINPK